MNVENILQREIIMITRITIRSESAYGPIEKSYKDRLTITRSSVRYEYEPLKPTDRNPPQKWTATNNSAQFGSMFRNLSEEVQSIFDNIPYDHASGYHDITTFTIMYDNGEKTERRFSLPDETFTVCFTIVDQMVKSANRQTV